MSKCMSLNESDDLLGDLSFYSFLNIVAFSEFLSSMSGLVINFFYSIKFYISLSYMGTCLMPAWTTSKDLIGKTELKKSKLLCLAFLRMDSGCGFETLEDYVSTTFVAVIGNFSFPMWMVWNIPDGS